MLPGDVESERSRANGRVGGARCVALKCERTIGHIAVSVPVRQERLKTGGHVAGTGPVVEERAVTDSGVSAGGVEIESSVTERRVAFARSIGTKRRSPIAVLLLPLVSL